MATETNSTDEARSPKHERQYRRKTFIQKWRVRWFTLYHRIYPQRCRIRQYYNDNEVYVEFRKWANGQNGTDPWEDYSPSQMSMRHYVVSEPVLINFGELPFVSHILPLTARINDFIKERSSTMNPQLLNILIILLIITLSIPFVLIIVGIVIAVVFNIKERKASLKRKATVTRLKEELTKKGNE